MQNDVRDERRAGLAGGPPGGDVEAAATGARSAGRYALVVRTLLVALDAGSGDSQRTPRVLDCGGGSGTFAVPLARAGADVTVVDISIDALATLARRSAEAGVAERVRPVQGDVESLAEVADPDGYDLVLAHGILEAVDDVPSAFAHLAAAVHAGGRLSVLVGNPVAAVLARALAGDPVAALRELETPDSSSPAVIGELCEVHGLQIERTQGIGVFSDLMPGAALDVPGAREALAELESRCATRSPFADIAGRTHLLARRPER